MKFLMLSAVAVTALGFAQAAQAEQKLFVQGDMVRGVQQGAPGPGCVLNGQFKHLEKVVFRIRVLDADGKALDDKGLKSLVVELPNGQKVNARYGKHPGGNAPGTDFFWTAAWIIPADYPDGSLSYKVDATASDGAEVTWEPFKVAASTLMVQAGAIEIKKP
jgi:hypothetical protein